MRTNLKGAYKPLKDICITDKIDQWATGTFFSSGKFCNGSANGIAEIIIMFMCFSVFYKIQIQLQLLFAKKEQVYCARKINLKNTEKVYLI